MRAPSEAERYQDWLIEAARAGYVGLSVTELREAKGEIIASEITRDPLFRRIVESIVLEQAPAVLRGLMMGQS